MTVVLPLFIAPTAPRIPDSSRPNQLAPTRSKAAGPRHDRACANNVARARDPQFDGRDPISVRVEARQVTDARHATNVPAEIVSCGVVEVRV